MMPKARTEKLSVRQLVEETVVYDLDRHKAHSLNAAAAFVWRHCDGQTSIAELARLLHAELKLPESEALVRLALDQLARRDLLQEAAPALSTSARLSRRDALKKLAIAAIALPVIMTITRRRAGAATYVGASQPCPPGTTGCGDVFGLKPCCSAAETCVNGQCVANQAAKAPPPPPPCIPIGASCVLGGVTPCCSGSCANGSTCA